MQNSLRSKKGSGFKFNRHIVAFESLAIGKNWFGSALGLWGQEPAEFFASLSKFKLTSELSAAQVEAKLTDRKTARDSKNWSTADVIRDELLAQGIQIQDTPNGTKWTVQL